MPLLEVLREEAPPLGDRAGMAATIQPRQRTRRRIAAGQHEVEYVHAAARCDESRHARKQRRDDNVGQMMHERVGEDAVEALVRQHRLVGHVANDEATREAARCRGDVVGVDVDADVVRAGERTRIRARPTADVEDATNAREVDPLEERPQLVAGERCLQCAIDDRHLEQSVSDLAKRIRHGAGAWEGINATGRGTPESRAPMNRCGATSPPRPR